MLLLDRVDMGGMDDAGGMGDLGDLTAPRPAQRP